MHIQRCPSFVLWNLCSFRGGIDIFRSRAYGTVNPEPEKQDICPGSAREAHYTLNGPITQGNAHGR
jgi:hypothetical protein